MLLIGENIHIIAPRVKEAIEGRDKTAIQDLARRQVEAGAGVLDLNIGPQTQARPRGHAVDRAGGAGRGATCRCRSTPPTWRPWRPASRSAASGPR